MGYNHAALMNWNTIIGVLVVAYSNICWSQQCGSSGVPMQMVQDQSLFRGIQFSITLETNEITSNSINVVHCQIKNSSTNAIKFDTGSAIVMIGLTNFQGKLYSFTPLETSSVSYNFAASLKPGEIFYYSPHFVVGHPPEREFDFPPKNQHGPVELNGDYQLYATFVILSPMTNNTNNTNKGFYNVFYSNSERVTVRK
jgi:hypothetical protein